MMTDQDREEMKLLIQETLVEVLKTHHNHEDLRSMIQRAVTDCMAGNRAADVPAANGRESYARRAAIADEDMRRKLAKKARKNND